MVGILSLLRYLYRRSSPKAETMTGQTTEDDTLQVRFMQFLANNESMCVHTFPSLCPGLGVRIYHSNTRIHWHGQGPGLSWRQGWFIYMNVFVLGMYLLNISQRNIHEIPWGENTDHVKACALSSWAVSRWPRWDSRRLACHNLQWCSVSCFPGPGKSWATPSPLVFY